MIPFSLMSINDTISNAEISAIIVNDVINIVIRRLYVLLMPVHIAQVRVWVLSHLISYTRGTSTILKPNPSKVNHKSSLSKRVEKTVYMLDDDEGDINKPFTEYEIDTVPRMVGPPNQY
eukprot:Tbor_TRINITY_DN4151_c0_g2::TRINITY_DN4151_c0_g2_i1::g.26508::m.26508